MTLKEKRLFCSLFFFSLLPWSAVGKCSCSLIIIVKEGMVVAKSAVMVVVVKISM